MAAMQRADDPDGALDAAYRRTRYQVHSSGGLVVLQIDIPNPALRALHRQLGVSDSAFLTAWNPRSVPQAAELNAAAHERLCQRLAMLGLAYWPGWGCDPRGEWPAEQSVFVPGLQLAGARRLGGEFSQHALVHSAADAVPRLSWL